MTQSKCRKTVPATLRRKKLSRCDLLHKGIPRPGVNVSRWPRKTCDPVFDPQRDISTDYALISIGVGAALIALIYLILT